MTKNQSTPLGGPYGRRLYVDVVDETAKADPDRPWIYVPRTSSAKDGWKVLTWGQHANAVNRTANWLVEKLGKPEHKSFPSIAYVGPNDARYIVLFAAGVKAGYQIMFPSPRNNTESQVSLLQVTKCQHLLYGSEYAKRMQPWVEGSNVNTLEMLALDTVFEDSTPPVHPYNETFESAEFDPVIILHTSGSTGIPKPIYCNQGLFCSADNYHNFLEVDGFPFIMEAMATCSNCSYCPLPLFHGFGLYCFINICGYWGKPMALGVGDRPLTAESVVEGYEAAGCDALVVPPSIVEDISLLSGSLEKLQKLSYVACGGGGLSKEVGDSLTASGVKLHSVISSTEYDLYPVYWQTNYDNWDFFIFDNAQFGCNYEHVGDNVYEQTIIRQAPHQPIFYTFPDATEYKTGDLFEAHPNLPNHWRSQGRTDNIIVFNNGEKLNPVSIEATVSLHPKVRQVMVVGHGYFQAGMILEPSEWPLHTSVEDFIDSVWPTIEKANAATVEHGRVSRHLVTISDPERPFLFSPKGSFRRGAVIKLYKEDIAALFTAEEVIEPATLDTQTLASLSSGVRALFKTATPGGSLEDDDDFFLQGIDSLQIINIAKRITAGLKIAGVDEELAVIAPRNVYAESTVTRLSKFVFNRIHNQGEKDTSNVTYLQNLIEKYTTGMSRDRDERRPPKSTASTVLLTGSTGSLGSYILHFLIYSSTVDKIICLNRSRDGGSAKQLEGNHTRGLTTEFGKVTFLHANLSQPELGLDADTYKMVTESVDSIIHNAWPVNFNIAVQSFEDHIRGVRHLIDLSRNAASKAAITFISSIGTVDKWTRSDPVPEENLTNLELASLGYGQAKQVSSLILDYAAKSAGVPASVVRLGQVAGPTTQQGSWNSHEWLPTIIESSLKLKALPDSLGSMEVDWVPVDKAARTVIEMAEFTSSAKDFSDGAPCFNLVNPAVRPWTTVVPSIVDFYKKRGLQLRLVGFDEWVRMVENAPSSANIAAVKLLDTYTSMAASAGKGRVQRFATSKAQVASKTLASMQAITPELLSLWCQQWNFHA